MKAKLKKSTLLTAHGALLIAKVGAQSEAARAAGAANENPHSDRHLEVAGEKIQYFNDICRAIDEIWPYIAEEG